jgi:hypothetical protein
MPAVMGASILEADSKEFLHMAKVPTFYSVQQAKKPEAHRVHHDNDRCFSSRDIPQHDRRAGDGGYRLCVECARLGAVELVRQPS